MQTKIKPNTVVLPTLRRLHHPILFSVIVAGVFAGIARAAVVPPGALVEGRSYSEWAASWWKWAYEIPNDGRHPLKDRTGHEALRNQSGSVWFLCWFLGPRDTSSTIVRNIAIPADKVLFVAIHGSACSTIEPPPSHCNDEGECAGCAASVVPDYVSCQVDGVSVSNLTAFASNSSLIEFTLPEQNIGGVPGGGGPAIGVGYGTHVMIEGLSPGLHTIRFTARYPQFNVAWDITYQVTVYAPAPLTIRPLPGTNLIELSWPLTSDFGLLQADSLDPSATWVGAAVISSSVANGTQFVTVTNDSGSRFFRLYKPW